MSQMQQELLSMLEELAKRLGYELRYEALSGESDFGVRSGVCRLHEHEMIILDSALPLLAKIEMLAQIFRHRNLEAVFLPPALRDLLEQ